MSGAYRAIGLSVVAIALPTLLGGCEVGAKKVEQTGYRGTGMQQVTDVSSIKAAAVIPPPAYPLPADEGPLASAAYQNVPVLGSMSSARFDHLMAQITQWVAPPEQGCNYCHNPANLASDEKYTKIVARRMLQMTQTINSRWSSHVQETGVTCYTCHRGNAVPENVWAVAMGTPNPGSIRGNKRGQNAPDPNVGYASLPYDPFEAYFGGNADVRVIGNSSYPPANGTGKSIKDAEASYALMMHVSTALGVNCTYCHNTQSMASWDLSRSQRTTAYYGVRMVRDVNANYITSLAAVFPANRKGPQGDPYKVNCTTCHQGIAKPLGGVSMIDQAPWLRGGTTAVAAPEGGAAGAAAVAAQFDDPRAANTGETSNTTAPVAATDAPEMKK